jgi:hypothetical protein
VLFLRLHRTRPFLAGVSLWLCMIKPHLFLPFGVVPLAWIVVTRSYKVLAGTVVALAASCALVYLVDPTAFSQYLQMIRTVELRARLPGGSNGIQPIPADDSHSWSRSGIHSMPEHRAAILSTRRPERSWAFVFGRAHPGDGE